MYFSDQTFKSYPPRLKFVFDSQSEGPLERMLKSGDGILFLLRPNQ
jgi:hypothetical protein